MRRLSTLVHARKVRESCEWCAQPTGARDPLRTWPILPGLFHSDCAAIAHARTLCVCGHEGGPWESQLSGSPYGYCLSCGRYRCWTSPAERLDAAYPGDLATRLLAEVPNGQRAPEVLLTVAALWERYRCR